MTGAQHSAHQRVSPIAWLLVWPIRFYQRWISRFTPPTCRYYPCCSSYGITALRTHGAVKGLLLTAWRIVRCNPWSSGGIDHVPERGRWRNADDQPVDSVLPDDNFTDTAIGMGSVIYVGLAGSDHAETDHAETDHAGADSSDAPTAGRTAA